LVTETPLTSSYSMVAYYSKDGSCSGAIINLKTYSFGCNLDLDSNNTTWRFVYFCNGNQVSKSDVNCVNLNNVKEPEIFNIGTCIQNGYNIYDAYYRCGSISLTKQNSIIRKDYYVNNCFGPYIQNVYYFNTC